MATFSYLFAHHVNQVAYRQASHHRIVYVHTGDQASGYILLFKGSDIKELGRSLKLDVQTHHLPPYALLNDMGVTDIMVLLPLVGHSSIEGRIPSSFYMISRMPPAIFL